MLCGGELPPLLLVIVPPGVHSLSLSVVRCASADLCESMLGKALAYQSKAPTSPWTTIFGSQTQDRPVLPQLI